MRGVASHRISSCKRIHAVDMQRVDASSLAVCSSHDDPDASKIRDLAQRFSYECSPLTLDPASGRPLNPYGRTGLSGRGKLYNWGPNHAADPIVTRVSAADPNELEVVVIQRGDSGAWAFPGGMIDPGEEPEHAARREFEEEAMNVPTEQKAEAKAIASKIFAPDRGTVVYTGYIDDPRNTDHAVSVITVRGRVDVTIPIGRARHDDIDFELTYSCVSCPGVRSSSLDSGSNRIACSIISILNSHTN
jgi:ADP-ribose pyrophosphatase YjhB (NUDIX family)